jgi:membrane protease YdiL (CAAX protease family)
VIAVSKKNGILLILVVGIALIVTGRDFFEPWLYERHYLLVLIYDLVKYLIPILLLYLGIRWNFFSSTDIGLSKTIRGFGWPYKAILFTASYVIAVFVLHIVITRVTKATFDSNALVVNFGKHPDVPSQSLRIFLALLFSLGASFCEECYFRGLLANLLLDRGILFYVILSSFLFAIAHWSAGIYSMIPSFFFGVVQAYYFVKVRSLFPAITAHFFNNAIVRFVAVMASG